MLLRFFTLIVSSLFLTQVATSQDVSGNNAPVKPTIAQSLRQSTYWAIGAQYGLLGGTGISLHYSLANRFAFELSGGYITLGDGMWSLGAEAQYLLDNGPDNRLYALAGAGNYHVGKADTAGVIDNKLSHPFRLGLGVGYEYFIGPKASISAELPVVIFMPRAGGRAEVYPFPQVQFLYYFTID
jgi:hypothetical protein